MAASQLGAMPANQLNALPLYTAQQAGVGGTIFINQGGGFSRYFDQTQLGISGAAAAAFGGATFWLVSSFIDVKGCNSFNLLLRRINGTALPQVAIAGGITVYYQMRFSSTEVPLLSQGGVENLSSLAIVAISNSGIVGSFPALQTQSEVQTANFGWHVSLGNAAAGNNGNLTIFQDVRILIGFTINPPAANTWSATLTAAT